MTDRIAPGLAAGPVLTGVLIGFASLVVAEQGVLVTPCASCDARHQRLSKPVLPLSKPKGSAQDRASCVHYPTEKTNQDGRASDVTVPFDCAAHIPEHLTIVGP